MKFVHEAVQLNYFFKISSNSIHTFLTYDNYTKRIKTKGQQISFLYLSTVVPTEYSFQFI